MTSSVLKEECYTYTTYCFDDKVWSVSVNNDVSYVDDWEDQYKPNAFMSTFEMLDVATPRGRCENDSHPTRLIGGGVEVVSAAVAVCQCRGSEVVWSSGGVRWCGRVWE